MRTLVGYVLMVAGVGLVVFGLYRGLSPLGAVYADTLNDPLGERRPATVPAGGGVDQPRASEKAGTEIRNEMLLGLAWGVPGVVLVLVGTVIVKAQLIRRLSRARRDEAARNAEMLARRDTGVPLLRRPGSRG